MPMGGSYSPPAPPGYATRAFCKNTSTSTELAKQGDIVNRKTINNHLREQEMQAYRLRKEATVNREDVTGKL